MSHRTVSDPRALLAVVLALTACGGEPAPATGASAQNTQGGELRRVDTMPEVGTRPPNVRTPDVIAARDATASDLAVQLVAPERVGTVDDAHRADVGLVLEVENGAREAVAIAPATAVVEVYRDGELVEGCASSTPLKLPHALAPSVVHRAELVVPCPLTEDGEYAIVSTLVVGDDDPDTSTGDLHRADQAELIVDAEMPPVGSTALQLAPVHAPPVSGTEVPSTADRLPEESGPGGPSRPSVP